jgi:transcription elongation factor GreA
MSTIQYVTKETLEQMKAELQRMRAVDRPAASRAIAEAREKGDLKENAEYDAAKEAQGILEARIAALEGAMANVRVLDESSIDTSKVSILTKVALTNLKTNKQVVYKIVSENEADLKAGKISVTSPIGKGILGKKVGETAEVVAPAGTLNFRIDSITARIIKGEIPCYKIAENQQFIAFLDVFPLREGHVLVVPKVEVDKIFDLPESYLQEMLVFAKPIAKAIEKTFPCARCGVEVIGLEVPHAHMHLIPINTANDLNFAQPGKIKATDEQLQQVQARLLANL